MAPPKMVLFSHKIDYVKFFEDSKSRVTAILLIVWILPIGGALAVEGLQSMGLPRLVLLYTTIVQFFSQSVVDTWLACWLATQIKIK